MYKGTSLQLDDAQTNDMTVRATSVGKYQESITISIWFDHIFYFTIDPSDIFRRHRASLVKLLASSSLELANELYSNGLVERNAIDDASTLGLPEYFRSSRVFDSIHNFLDASENRKAVLSKFCDILDGLYETVKPLVSKMKKELQDCRDTVSTKTVIKQESWGYLYSLL